MNNRCISNYIVFVFILIITGSGIHAYASDSLKTVFTPSLGLHYGTLFKHRTSIEGIPNVNPMGVPKQAKYL